MKKVLGTARPRPSPVASKTHVRSFSCLAACACLYHLFPASTRFSMYGFKDKNGIYGNALEVLNHDLLFQPRGVVKTMASSCVP